jgi:hypothetical protein
MGMHELADAREIAPERELRLLADAFEQIQNVRLQTGERIRATLRDGPIRAALPADGEASEELQRILNGETDGPLPLLGRTYRRFWLEEREIARTVGELLEAHPAWPWLREVKGVGPLVAGKLVARLDIHKAATPSAFWAYCGLATVPGVEYRCAVCGFKGSFASESRLPREHKRPGRRGSCEARMEVVRGAEEGVRVAQTRPERGDRSPYDAKAKKACYLIGVSMLRAGGPYEERYRAERRRLDQERSDWTDARKHLAALRKMEKLFLSHLWLVWRTALDLPLTQPYPHAHLGAEGFIDPWQMVGDGGQPLPSRSGSRVHPRRPRPM